MSEERHQRRRYPRRLFRRKTGVLARGVYTVCSAHELGEGGILVEVTEKVKEGQDLVVSFQVPGGEFLIIRGETRYARPTEQGTFLCGLQFYELSTEIKKMIRRFVCEKTAAEFTEASELEKSLSEDLAVQERASEEDSLPQAA